MPRFACHAPHQAHAFTCSTRRGSLGQHFRVLGGEGGGAGERRRKLVRPTVTAAAAALATEHTEVLP